MPGRDVYAAIDFDGTCVEHAFPRLGRDLGAAPWLRHASAMGTKLILLTMRDGVAQDPDTNRSTLVEAVDWFARNQIPLFGVNANPDQQALRLFSAKVYAHLYVDDAALGAPLREGSIDWERAGPELLRFCRARLTAKRHKET